MTLSLPIDEGANELLRRSPLALLIAMILDQQIPLERAFAAPYDLARRIGHEPDARELAGYDATALTAVFAQRPALHRFPKAMAARLPSSTTYSVVALRPSSSRNVSESSGSS